MSWSPNYVIGGSGDGGSSGFARRRNITIGGKDFVSYAESVETSKTELKAIVGAVEPLLTEAQISMHVLSIGAGGAGGSGDPAYGGFPGQVVEQTFAMSDLTDGPIYIDIGAGGLGAAGSAGGAGSYSMFSDYLSGLPGFSPIYAEGGPGGALTDENQKAIFPTFIARGAAMADPSGQVTGLPNGNGPGMGGSIRDGAASYGGTASSADFSNANGGGYYAGTPGNDAYSASLRSFGAGGASNDAGLGGNGGAGGGAGGAATAEFPGGNGGGGEVRIQFFVLEVV
jgi:hypothetical protein